MLSLLLSNVSIHFLTGNYDIIQQPENISEAAKVNVSFYMFVDEETEEYIRNSTGLGNTKWVGLWRIIVVHHLPYADARRNGKVILLRRFGCQLSFDFSDSLCNLLTFWTIICIWFAKWALRLFWFLSAWCDFLYNIRLILIKHRLLQNKVLNQIREPFGHMAIMFKSCRT